VGEGERKTDWGMEEEKRGEMVRGGWLYGGWVE
jgi:hypothetical protein